MFIAPPSVEALQERLKGRGSETEEQMAVRLSNAQAEIDFGTEANFDCVIVNDRLEDAVNALANLLCEWFPSISTPDEVTAEVDEASIMPSADSNSKA